MVSLSKRVTTRPPYPFAAISRERDRLLAAGHRVIDLGVGDCTMGTPSQVVETLKQYAGIPESHHYSSYNGILPLRTAIAAWMERRFGLSADPANEITALIGSKEGIFRFPLAVINPGELALIPEPGYPPYAAGVELAGGTVYWLPLTEKNRFLPDLDAIPEAIKKQAKVIYVNYPNNPTAAEADAPFYEKLYSLAASYDWIVVSDMAYGELYDETPPLSALQFDLKKERTIEFYSFSKSYAMTGWRLGFAVGNHELIRGLMAIKTEQDSAPFDPIQRAGITALSLDNTTMDSIRSVYRNTRQKMHTALQNAAISYFKSSSGFYVWAKVPAGYTSLSFTTRLLQELKIVVTPGSTLGPTGEGWFRVTVTRSEEDMRELDLRLRQVKTW